MKLLLPLVVALPLAPDRRAIPNHPPASAHESFPFATAKVRQYRVMAKAWSPSAKAAPNSPLTFASAPLPIAMAMLVGLLVQFRLLPMPKNDAHVAFAAGAPAPSAPAANAPETYAPRNTPALV